MTTRFKNAIDALVKGFFDGTLGKFTCGACAVGNIVAYSHGVKADMSDSGVPIKIDGIEYVHSDWRYIDPTCSFHKFQTLIGLKIIEKTGYSVDDLLMIEDAFENNTIICHWSYDRHKEEEIIEDQYNGLMAVVEALCEIEGIEDPTEYKELFAYA